jgi:hypothetical protein
VMDGEIFRGLMFCLAFDLLVGAVVGLVFC